MPVSEQQRARYSESLQSLVADLSLHGGTPIPMAMGMTASDAHGFFKSSAFTNHRKTLESKQKMQLAVLGRFDGIAKGIGGLGKLIASISKRKSPF